MHVSFPGNLDLSPEKAYLSRKKYISNLSCNSLLHKMILLLEMSKKVVGGQGQARQGVLWLEGGQWGETIGLTNLSPTLLLQLLISFEVARKPLEAHFSLYFTTMDKGCSSPDDTFVPDILLILKQNKYHIT